MLTPQELLEIVDTLYPQIDKLQQWITEDMMSRMLSRLGRGEGLVFSGTDKWQLELYRASGGHYDAVVKKIQEFTKATEREIKEIFEDIGVRAWDADDAFYVSQGLESIPMRQSERVLQILADTYERTNGEVRNFTRTTAEESQKKFVNILDDAHFKVVTGAQSYTQAVKDAVNELADTQTIVRYPTGHTDTIEVAILRAVRTGVAQASGNMTMQGMIDRDWDLIRVSAHLGARYGDGGQNPSNHFWWQGKLYSRTGRSEKYPPFEETTGYGTGGGLCGWNCRHSFSPGNESYNPFLDYDAEENKKAYDLSQKQRKAESRIRRQKSKVLALRQAKDEAQDEALKQELTEDYQKEAKKLSNYNAAYNKLCKDNNLKRLSDRVSIAKWTRSEAVKAAAAARKAN